jgi:RNAse (barnase) inhibitor barstar
MESRFSDITFISDKGQKQDPDAYQGTVLGRVPDKKALLEQLAQSLKFPTYFGFNWDALSECLRDFHWITQREIIIVHEQLPSLSRQDLRTYLEILTNAVGMWKKTNEHSLKIFFPEEARSTIREILQ